MNREDIQIDEFIEVTLSSRQNSRKRRIEEHQERLEAGDILIVTELSRFDRSMGEVILLINQLVDFGAGVIVIKQNFRLGKGLKDMTAKVMVTLLALFA